VFVRSLSRLSEVNLGYHRENLLLFRVNAAAGGYKGPAATRLYQDLLEKLAAIPGLRAVTVSHNGVFIGSESGDPIAVEGYTPKPDEEMNSSMDHVGPGYFSTMGIPILLGREIEPQDSGNGPRAAVINQTFARQFFPNTNPIGKHGHRRRGLRREVQQFARKNAPANLCAAVQSHVGTGRCGL
jgi:hypothetical protein